jgi:CelD/BcsL family acetyltransferase involved in cellulose biosynthesis
VVSVEHNNRRMGDGYRTGDGDSGNPTALEIGLPALTPIGAGISDFSDILLDDSCAGEAARRLARELANQYCCHIIDLPEVRDGAVAWQLAEVWPHRTWRLQGSTCLDLPARPLEELIEDLPPKAAKTRRTKRRKIQETGIQSGVATSDEAAAAGGNDDQTAPPALAWP